jgi:cell division transport system permease protein
LTEPVRTASADISAFPEVSAVNYVSEDEALKRARNELVEFRDAYRDLSTNPLPASLEIRLKPGSRNAETVTAVAERLKGFTFVDDVRFGRDWIAKLDRLRNLLGLVGLMVGGAFAVVAVVIIGTTIRMAVLQRAREIHIMRLVGATNWFIRGPFLLEGALKGLLGGALALALCYGGYTVFRGNTPALAGLVFFQPIHLLVILVFGVLLGLLGSLISVGRHLRTLGGRTDRRVV